MRCNNGIERVNGHSSRFGECLFVAEPGPTATDPAIARDGERAETGGRFI